jgi:MarR-like DNA-binding transcriptional regulator SgrR of sgrS sRNA
VLVADRTKSFALNDQKERLAMGILQTYKAIPDKIDPSHILTIAELELSTALSTPLVAFDDDRGLVARLAERWKIDGKELQFTLKEQLKWSDGSRVTADQYRRSLLRAKRLYSSDLKALFDVIEKIEVTDERTLVFTTKTPVTESGILLKLSEPMYGLVAVNESGELDLSKSVGPYYVKNQVKDHLSLSINNHWISMAEGMPSAVEIRPTSNIAGTAADFANEKWANLVSGNSIMPERTLAEFKSKGFHVWQRSLDRLFALFPSSAFAKHGGSELLRTLSSTIDRNELLAGLAGFSLANQFFPRGYVLWSQSTPHVTKIELPKYNGIIRIIALESYKSLGFVERIANAIEKLHLKVSLEFIKLTDLNLRMKTQDFEILITGVAVADPNFEGAISFFIERDPPFVPSGIAPNDFSEQIRKARSLRTSSERADKMKETVIRAQEAGYVFPIFHFSSLSVSRPEVDLSSIPNTDETIHFEKVRIKQ